jgi:hypothetical protein
MQLRAFVFSALLSMIGFGQTRQSSIQDRFANLDFAGGALGVMPPGWRLGPEGTTSCTAEIASGAYCPSGQQCTVVRSKGDTANSLSFLYQVVDATPYRGKRLTYRAAVRAEVAGTSVARLLVRIHREDGSTSFRDDMGDHPITAGPWRDYAIAAPIAADARDIEFGLQLVGQGSASISGISIMFGSPRSAADENTLRALVRKLAELRNAGEGAGVAALYSESGEWFYDNANPVRGRSNLAATWGNLPGRVERSIESIDFLGGDVAVIRVTTLYNDPPSRHHESLVVVKENGTWYIRAHQSVD